MLQKLGIGSFGDKRDGASLLLGLLEFGLLLADLLHFEHSLHDKLVLALLINVTLILTLPWKIELRLAALIERDQQMGALVSVGDGHPRLHHLCLRCYHWLR